MEMGTPARCSSSGVQLRVSHNLTGCYACQNEQEGLGLGNDITEILKNDMTVAEKSLLFLNLFFRNYIFIYFVFFSLTLFLFNLRKSCNL